LKAGLLAEIVAFRRVLARPIRARDGQLDAVCLVRLTGCDWEAFLKAAVHETMLARRHPAIAD
jgi:hypothetical protein